jgi:hypothetical protein
MTNKRLAACVLAVALSVAQLLPGIALACEGGGTEAQLIVIKPFAEGEVGGLKVPCHENAVPEVEYQAPTKFCEFEVKNENMTEEVTIRGEETNLPIGSECAEKACLGFTPVEGGRTQCVVNMTKLAALGGACYSRIEYKNKPGKSRKAGFDVITKSSGGATGSAEVPQLVHE